MKSSLGRFCPRSHTCVDDPHLTEEVRWIDHLTIVPKDLLKAAFDQRQSSLFPFKLRTLVMVVLVGSFF